MSRFRRGYGVSNGSNSAAVAQELQTVILGFGNRGRSAALI
ncbi:hypothetical protein [Novipirellula caenicola]